MQKSVARTKKLTRTVDGRIDVVATAFPLRVSQLRQINTDQER
jgi:hypothetical protein